MKYQVIIQSINKNIVKVELINDEDTIAGVIQDIGNLLPQILMKGKSISLSVKCKI